MVPIRNCEVVGGFYCILTAEPGLRSSLAAQFRESQTSDSDCGNSTPELERPQQCLVDNQRRRPQHNQPCEPHVYLWVICQPVPFGENAQRLQTEVEHHRTE